MSAMSHVDKHYTAKLVLLYLFTVNCQLHKENVALNGTCSMTTKYPNTGDCTEVIDNVTDLDLRFTNDEGIANCIHTTNTNPDGCSPFWQLVLNEDFTITNITIYSRAGYPQRLTNTAVTVDGTLCQSFGSDVSSFVQNDVASFQCSPPIRGRTVKISRNSNCSDDGEFTLNLCEVQVWVCSKGWFGNDCNTPCSGHCSIKATCDRYNGSCPTDCINGWYGSRCDNSCQNCVGACVQSSGVCSGCIIRWYGSKCNYSCPVNCKSACNQSSGACYECNESYYGQNCTAKCGHCSQGHICNKADGSCPSCEPGWERPLCAQECNEGYYGPNCTAKCGHCSQGQICNKTDGSCLSCEPGWEPPLCIQCYTAAKCACPAQSNCDGSQVGVGIGSAVSGAAVVIIAEVLLFLVYRWRRNSEKKQATERGDQSVSDNKLTNLQVHYSSGLRNEEIPCAETTHLESSYDKLESNALYENTKEQSVYTGLKKD